jgi:hypothetical protein
MGKKREEFKQLLDYVRGQVSPEDKDRIERQIADDPDLKEIVRVLSELRHEIDTTEWRKMQQPSHALFNRLLKDVKASNSKTGKKQCITVYDSRLLPLPDGVRRATLDTSRIKYLIGKAQLEVSLYPTSPNSFEIIGQLSERESTKTLDIELRSGKTRLTVKANRFNLFRFPRVPAGVYKLLLKEGNSVIGQVDLEL